MGVIAKYKFDQTIYENFIPEFNSAFTYTITDETDTDGFTIRTIESDDLPALMRFGAYTETDRERSLLEVYECNTENITSMTYMFCNCSKLTSLDLSNFNTEKVTNMQNMFNVCSSLTSLDVSNFKVSQVIDMQSMFNGCSSLTSLDLSSWNTDEMTNTYRMFNNCSSLTYLNLSNFNTEKVTSMGYMFAGCSSLTLLDVSNFNTEKVTNMTNMFQDCSSLTHLDISMFNGSALITGGSMFYGCVSLQEIIFPKKFITNKCVNISATFRNCPSLKYVNVSDWDTSSVTTINQTFNGCKSLTSLDLSSWDTTNVTSYYQAFNGCTSLQSLDISNFNILSSVTDTNTHITVCKKLVHVGMLYCNSETINVIANQIGGTRTIWYQDANLSDLTQLDNITYKKYQSTTLSLNEPIQLRSIGDVHDEINYETGEYIQCIGEIVFDGSEDENWYMDMLSNDDTRLNMTFKVDLDNIIDYNFATTGMLCDRFIQVTGSSLWGDDVQGIGSSNGSGVKIGIPKSNLTTQNVNGFRYWLSQNPITVQYQLATPIIKTVPTTILDQNNNYKSSQQTYDEQTYVSVQSDTVVTPTSSVDYEIYSSTGTVTGTSATIDNAEAGTPVSGVVYGETLLNVIQEPSEDEFVITGDVFEEQSGTLENTVEGNIKSAILKGQTLVNLFKKSVDIKEMFPNYQIASFTTLNGEEVIKIYGNNRNRFKLISTPKTSFTIKMRCSLTSELNSAVQIITFFKDGSSVLSERKLTTNVDELTEVIYSYSGDKEIDYISLDTSGVNSAYLDVNNLVIIEGDYTNVDVPYFNGIGSVTNYRTINNMQSTCTYSENNGTYWCDTTTVNPTVGKQYFIKIFNNPNNAITRFFYGGVIVDTTTDYGIVTATDRTGMRLHFYNLNSATVTITEEQKNAIRFLICEYQDGMENWEINEHFEESYTVQMPILKTVGKNLLNDNTSVSGWIMEDGTTTIRGALGSGADYLSDFIYVGNINQIKISRSCYVTTFDESKKIISQFANVVDVNVSNCSYIRIAASCDGQTALGLVGTIQVEEGTVTTTYQAHKSTTVTVNENIELNSIGDVRDELNATTGELTQRIGNITLDGNRNYSIDDGYNGETEEYFGFRTSLADYKPIESNANVLSGDIKIIPFFNLKNVSGEWISFRYPSSGVIYGKILKSKLTEQTIQGIQQYLSENPITLRYELATSVTRTVPILIIDQDNVQQKYVQTYDTITYLKPQSYELIPTVEYKNPSYDVLLKENTQYTIKLNRTNIVEGTPLTVNLGGTELSIEDSADSFTITTPSTLTNNTLSIGGANNKVKEVMVIEGDCVDRDLDFFEGFISVENPILHITCKNLFNPKNTFKVGYMNWQTGQVVYADNYNNSVTDFIPIQEIELGTYYFHYKNETNRIDICFYDENKNFICGFVTKAVIPNTARYMRVLVYNIKQTIIPLQMEKGNSKTTYEPYQGNTLTTYPQVTLRSIGDIKDEWDVVGETVTRRIGEIVLDGNSGYHSALFSVGNNTVYMQWFDNVNQKIPSMKINSKLLCDRLPNLEAHLTDIEGIDCHTINGNLHFNISKDKLTGYNLTFEGMKQYLNDNPLLILYELETPITESVRITPPNPQTSTASITIPTQLNHVEDTSDFLVWNPYKEHYVRYNYVEDGVVLDNHTWENLTYLNERQFVEFYNRRTYIDQPYHNYVASHDSKGTSKYVLIEPNQNYTVSVRFSELPTCETVKVNLGGTEVEMNVNDPHVHVTTPNTLVNNLCSISGDGLDGKVTDILVIHCLEHEGFADIDYFEGIDGIGEIVEVDGVPKSKIVMEQTNGNLIDDEFEVWNNGQSLKMGDSKRLVIHPNTKYVVKFRRDMDEELAYTIYVQLFNKDNVQTRIVNGEATNESNTREFTTNHDETMVRLYTSKVTNNGSTHRHYDIDLCYANMSKDYIRPRWYDKEEILLPIQLHRINTVYDNFYYDEMKGYYRIQQSIGHKYFVGADSENWTLIERGQRVLRFRYNNADIQIKSLGEFRTNILPNGTATSPYECCAFNGINFIVSIDKERLSSESLTAFKEWLANNNLHLYYQLASPLMIDLPQYPNRIEFNTYKDELYTFFKNCKPTVFTLSVPLDQTYRFYELEQGEGYANRVELTDERMTEEDTLYINTIYGSGIGNLIEEPNNVDTMLKPNYEGKATSHSLTNGKVSTIGVHGFEPNDVTISNYNTVTKQYELTVQAQKGNSTNTKVLPIPYKFEVYEDGTKDRVYYNSQYKQWMFEGGQTLTVPYNASTGAFTNAIEVFRGLQPRSGLIGEFKVRFTSGTTSVRLYYSINGTTYGYTTLRDMTDEVDYYIGFFNTGGSKIDMGTKIDANAEYTKLVPINGTIPECLMINQIQNITECTYYQDKTYYYSDVVSPLLLDVYDGTTTITELNGAVIDIQNNAHNKQALIYGDTTYTVYWTYVGGEGNIKVTLGGTTQEVVATQGYVTITTSDTDLEKGLFIGGFNVTIKDLMLVKGERITDLKYFEGSRAVGTAFTDENGETMYKITLVTGSELINDKFEEVITFEDNKKHNVVVTKLLGAKPDKI